MSKQEIVLQLTLKIIEHDGLSKAPSAVARKDKENVQEYYDTTILYVAKIFNTLMDNLNVE